LNESKNLASKLEGAMFAMEVIIHLDKDEIINIFDFYKNKANIQNTNLKNTKTYG
jgi:hypothetical protein